MSISSYIVEQQAQSRGTTSDRECERKLCPHATRGSCRYTNGECKYLHIHCQDYDSCSQPNCRLAHARKSHPPLCRKGMECFKVGCKFEHPEGWSACADGVQCTADECTPNHPPDRRKNPLDGRQSNSENYASPHSKTTTGQCSWGEKCRNWHCKKAHPINRIQLCPSGGHCKNDRCGCLHPLEHTERAQPKVPPPRPMESRSEVIKLDGAELNFLRIFGNKTLDEIRKVPDIKDVIFKDGELQVTGIGLAIENVKTYLAQALHKRDLTISCSLRKYLELKCNPPLL